MKYVILGDIHSNLQALERATEAFSKIKADGLISVGDIVGYGANPNECVKKVVSLKVKSVLGNHDAAASGRHSIENFNAHAKAAMEWTRCQLNESSRLFLEKLPLVLKEKVFEVAHGTLHQPDEFHYLMTGSDAAHTFEVMRTNLCFVGHSHVPGVFVFKGGRVFNAFKKEVALDGKNKYIVNAGSIGQPRDGDPRASWCVYDTDKSTIKFYRTEYDIQSAKENIYKKGLPKRLGDRLLLGL